VSDKLSAINIFTKEVIIQKTLSTDRGMGYNAVHPSPEQLELKDRANVPKKNYIKKGLIK
jgi:hypothetical protein